MRTILICYLPCPMYICVCNAVTDREIRAAADLGARSIEDLRDTLGVATCCRRCESSAKTVLQQALDQTACAAEPCA